MRYSKVFPKTRKTPPKDAESVNHKLLVRGGFIDQLMAGSWTLLPLGWRVVTKINEIIRQEMNAIGGQEMLMPLLHPKSVWNETGRWEKASDIMYKLKDQHEREYALSFTHEEIVMDLIRKYVTSYHDLPLSVYHFSTKFRNEPRARSGILRGREFMMKDLYSAHVSEKDLMSYYGQVKDAYVKIFRRLGFDIRVTEATGGVFTKQHTHEFQVITPGGEDTIYHCTSCSWGQNQEIFQGSEGDTCPSCKKGTMKQSRSIEVGNIFPLGTWYAEAMGVTFTDKEGSKKPVWFGSYGIGPTRVMGALVEVSHDENGIIWNPAVAPFQVQLLSFAGVDNEAEVLYKRLISAGFDVLWDERNESAGVKMADADLLGIPWRFVVSQKTGTSVEIKQRNRKDIRVVGISEALKHLHVTYST